MKNKDDGYVMSFNQATSTDLIVVEEFTSEFNRKLKKYINKTGKRMLDIVGGVIGVIALVPITILVFVASKVLKEKGPIIYSQYRLGKDGKIFKMYKFRTMVIDADKKLIQYLNQNPEAKKEYQKYKKLKNDPRVTRLGKILRRTSIDEVPQFINVLKGEMSLVGPRPYLPEEKEEMGSYFYYIKNSKPGITGIWQIGGRSNISFEDRLDMDVKFYKTESIKRDINLIYKTIQKVLKKEGAI